MNRQNFLGHLALALMLIVVAVFVGQLRRWDSKKELVDVRPRVVVELEREHETLDKSYELGEPEVLVRFREGVSEERIAEIVSGFTDRVEDEIEVVGGLVAVDSLDNEDAARVVADYSSLPEVEYVEKNEEIRLPPMERARPDERFASPLPGGPNDPRLAEQWALINTGQREGKERADISALGAWAKTHGNRKVVVAVLDSGVDYTHPDLSNNMWVRPDSLDPYFDEQLGEVDDVNGFSALGEARDPMDENGHGTHCAGIVGAEGDNGEGIAGVNWQVEIMPLKFMGAGGFGTTKDAIEAINYVIERKRAGVNVRVISASWGSRQKSRALGDVIRKAGEEGIIFIAAAGNNHENADRFPHYPSGYDLPNVVSVAALNRRDELASFSNFGPKSVHVAAPGAEILSTWLRGDYEEHSGTSMATPVVAGVAALILSVEPDLSVEELKKRLMDSVDKLDTLQGKIASAGRVNAARAVGATK